MQVRSYDQYFPLQLYPKLIFIDRLRQWGKDCISEERRVYLIRENRVWSGLEPADRKLSVKRLSNL